KWDTEQGSFQAWLNTVARNTIIDAIRKRDRIRERPLSGLPDDDEQPLSKYEDPCPGPEQELEAAEAQQILESALEQVTKPNHRIAWMLRHLEGYSIAEIARILNRKEGTVKIWIFRCTEELRKILIAKGIQWIY
ncbi:MAG: RNA polymerase sigma factor, partial [Candidatus Poribacteria bacterium]|nr:RNA polymerase sigma factor [Candidatus Poribacteria bacterium]